MSVGPLKSQGNLLSGMEREERALAIHSARALAQLYSAYSLVGCQFRQSEVTLSMCREVCAMWGREQLVVSERTGAIVCTFERANAFINRKLEEEALTMFSCIVVDELHMVRPQCPPYLFCWGHAHTGMCIEGLLMNAPSHSKGRTCQQD